jgi:thiol-disulfide isomerase/thioredoxin
MASERGIVLTRSGVNERFWSGPARGLLLLALGLTACAEAVNHPSGPPMAAFPQEGRTGLRRVTIGLWKASFSPDGKKLAVGRADSGIEVIELATGVRDKLTVFGKDPAWSPDGRFIAFADAGKGPGKEEVWLVEPAGGQPRLLATGEFPSWSRDGKRLFFVTRPQEQIFVLPIDDPAAQPSLFFGQVRAGYPAVSPDEQRVATVLEGELLVIERASGLEVARVRVTSGDGFASWSPDGKWVAYGSFSADGVWAYNPEARQFRALARGPFTIPTFSPDGKMVAFDQRVGGTNDIWVTDKFDLRLREPRGTTGVGAAVVGAVKTGTPGPSGPGPSWRWRKMPLAELDLRDLDGHLWKLRELEGKVALVNVWATWCGPCTKELPLVQKLHESLKGRADTVVLSLNIDDDPEKARKYAAEHKLTFPVLPASKYVTKAIGPSISIPRSWIVGGGLLTAESLGFNDGQGEAWLAKARAELERARPAK